MPQILDKAELSRAQAEQSIMDEIAIMERVRHPNIVNLKEVLPSRDKIHLILEHVSEGNLFNRIVRHGPLKVFHPLIPLYNLLFHITAS